MIPLDTARRIASACFTEASRIGIDNISVVVTDSDGAVKLALRSDTQGAFGIQTARAKARSALGFGMSTRKLAHVFAAHPASVAGIDGAVGGGFIPIAGAVVVVDSTARVLGSASISGGNPQSDDEVVRAAVNSVGLSALD